MSSRLVMVRLSLEGEIVRVRAEGTGIGAAVRRGGIAEAGRCRVGGALAEVGGRVGVASGEARRTASVTPAGTGAVWCRPRYLRRLIRL
ncbi:hypothetical protein Ade02nite_23340 [Paractinoplanes deccanensis]|uniref:Uncharacterized protein n=1 Tax=Paractinoplanes deccanensis TaxID=113561 RepID=A0ABQ3Y121_9ACTN|nr:hypothetical protein Ade02nite_23340 [Actinoplanes deccanensis]